MNSERDGANRDNWDAICLFLADGLEFVRNEWFRLCVEIARKVEADEEYKELGRGVSVKQTSLSGRGLLAAKTYQLCLVSHFLRECGYIPEESGQEFADLLYARVCGADLIECLSLVRRYNIDDAGARMFRVCSDIAEHITDSESHLIEATHLTRALPLFTFLTYIYVAHAFGDEETVSRLQTIIDRETKFE